MWTPQPARAATGRPKKDIKIDKTILFLFHKAKAQPQHSQSPAQPSAPGGDLTTAAYGKELLEATKHEAFVLGRAPVSIIANGVVGFWLVSCN